MFAYEGCVGIRAGGVTGNHTGTRALGRCAVTAEGAPGLGTQLPLSFPLTAGTVSGAQGRVRLSFPLPEWRLELG